MDEGNARGRIRLAAERLIAEHGAEVPLRDIAIAAGQRNNSAVQYHFGSREALITSILESRNQALDARRMERLAELEAQPLAPSEHDTVRVLVELLVGPMLEIPYQQGATHYARFLEQVRSHVITRSASPGGDQSPAIRIILSRLERALADIPPRLQRQRLTSLATVMFSLLADQERAAETGDFDASARALSEANIIDVLVALLVAPPSPEAVRAATAPRRRRARSA